MQRLFSVVAPRYDLITRVFSFGLDANWKRAAILLADLPAGARVLDLACGTADFSRMIQDRHSTAQVVASDLTESMVKQAHRNGVRDGVCADAMRLPFRDSSFNAVFVGYGLRNFPDLAHSLKEIRRVLRPGGVLAALDFYLPSNPVWRELYLGYLQAQGAAWGALLHGEPHIYTYIPESLRSFLSAAAFSRLLAQSGFADVRGRTYFWGGIAVHAARRV